MRVCPKCGFIDPPEWKHSKFSYHIDTVSFEEFSKMHPNLAKELKRGGGGSITEDKDYFYRLTKTKLRVLRKAKIEWTENRDPFGAEKYEKYKHGIPSVKDRIPHETDWKIWRSISPDQTKLLAEEGVST